MELLAQELVDTKMMNILVGILVDGLMKGLVDIQMY